MRLVQLVAIMLCTTAIGQEPVARPVEGPILDAVSQRLDAIVQRINDGDAMTAHEMSGIRSLLEDLRNRQPFDGEAMFPRIAELRESVTNARHDVLMGQGPIREAIGMLTQLVGGLSILTVILLLADVYRTFFKKA